MTIQCTIDRLIEMKLRTLADVLAVQRNDIRIKDLNFEGGFVMLVDIEYNNRRVNNHTNLIKMQISINL